MKIDRTPSTAAHDAKRGLTAAPKVAMCCAGSGQKTYFSFAVFFIGKKWVLMKVGYCTFSDSMETTYLPFEIKDWCEEKKWRRQQRVIF